MFKKIGKLIVFALIFLLALTGCGSSFTPPKENPSADAAVKNNGTRVVQKGDYIYYINGSGSNTADNTYGTPIKGSIVRSKLNEAGVATPANDKVNADSDAVTIVPKIFYSSASKAGLYIFGERLYYVSPSVKTDKKGNVLTSSTDVFSCKLDGTDNQELTYIASNSFDYRFWQDGDGTVYFVYVADSKVTSFNCGTRKSTTLVEKYTNTPVLGDDGNVYYTTSVQKSEDDETQLEMFNAFYSVPFKGGDAVELLDRNGKTLTTYYNAQRPAGDPDYDNGYDKVKQLKINPIAYYDGYVIFGRNDDARTGTTYNYTYAYQVSSKDVVFITKLSLTGIIPVKNALIASYSGSKIVKVPYGKSIFSTDASEADLAETVINSSVTVIKVTDDTIYYVNGDSKIASVPLEGSYMEKEEVVLSATKANTTNFTPVITDSVVYYLSSEGTFTDYLCYTVYTRDADGKPVVSENGNLVKSRIGLLSEADNKTLQEMHDAKKPTHEE